jgi:hypothetical protein
MISAVYSRFSGVFSGGSVSVTKWFCQEREKGLGGGGVIAPQAPSEIRENFMTYYHNCRKIFGEPLARNEGNRRNNAATGAPYRPSSRWARAWLGSQECASKSAPLLHYQWKSQDLPSPAENWERKRDENERAKQEERSKTNFIKWQPDAFPMVSSPRQPLLKPLHQKFPVLRPRWGQCTEAQRFQSNPSSCSQCHCQSPLKASPCLKVGDWMSTLSEDQRFLLV